MPKIQWNQKRYPGVEKTMDIEKLTGLTGLAHYKTLADRVLFNTDAGMLDIGFWDEDIVRIRIGDAKVNTYPIIVGKPAGKKIIQHC